VNELRMVETILPVLIPVLVGLAVVRAGLLQQQDAKALSSSFLYIFLPALIIGHLATQDLRSLFDVRFIAATAALICIIYLGAFLFNRIFLKRSLTIAALSAFACSKFNAVVVGLPLLVVAIGHPAIIAAVINMILGYVTIFPVTLVLLEIAKERAKGGDAGYGSVILTALRHVAVDPLVIATAVGLLLAAAHIHLPGWGTESLSVLGSAAIPVPLVAVGMTMSSFRLNDSMREAMWVTLVRVIASPILAILFAKLFGLSPVYAIALVISFSLPTAKMAFALAERHGVYEEQMGAIVTLSTVSLVVSFPLFLWICSHLWPGNGHAPSLAGIL